MQERRGRAGRRSTLLRTSILLVPLLLALAGLSASAAPNRQILPGHIPKALAHLKALSHLDTARRLHLSIGLPLRNSAQLTALLQQIYNPASPQYRHFLTPRQFTAQFGPTEDDYAAVESFALQHGLRIARTHPSRIVLDIEGDVASIESAFHTSLNVYQHPTQKRTFYAPDTEPSLDLAVPIVHISGLDDYSIPKPNLHLRSSVDSPAAHNTPHGGEASGGNYAGDDFRDAYVPGTSLTGAGQAVALVEFDNYYASDITSYEQSFNRSNIPLVNIAIDGGFGSPGSNNDEVALDIEMAISMAPSLSAVYVYEAPNSSAYWDDMLSRMADDDLASQLSCSWGGDGADSTAEQIFLQMAAQGQSFFTSSGDDDAYTGAVPFPAESPNITVVGGTTLTTTGARGSYTSEKVWNWGLDSKTSAYTGSSGGTSTDYTIPSYQASVSMANNLGSTTYRNMPDVALTADDIWVDYGNGSSGSFGGTSCAAPLWAGFMALANQQALAGGNATAGFINPAVYTIAQSSNYNTAFHDTTTGNNFTGTSSPKFSAVTGYDLCTGWGTPTGTPLINLLVPTPTTSAAPVITVAANENAINGTFFGYQIQATYSPTSYNVGNLPPGMTINTANGFISGTPTTNGSYNVSLAASNAKGTGSASVTIVVSTAPIPVINSAQTAYVTLGNSFSYQITASNNPTRYNATGLPSGLNVSTRHGTITGTPTSTGTSDITLTATNSNGSGTATLVLIVQQAPAFTNSALSTTIQDNAAYNFTYTASGYPSATFSVTPGSLPAGLNLSSAGVLSGMPTQNGTFSGTVTATNTAGSATQAFSLMVDTPPTFTNNADSDTISTGSSYNFTFTAGGYPSPTFSLTAGSFPPGLTLSSAGVLSGTPTQAGTFTGTVTASSSDGTTTQNFTITVNSLDLGDSSPTLPPLGLVALAALLLFAASRKFRAPNLNAS